MSVEMMREPDVIRHPDQPYIGMHAHLHRCVARRMTWSVACIGREDEVAVRVESRRKGLGSTRSLCGDGLAYIGRPGLRMRCGHHIRGGSRFRAALPARIDLVSTGGG